jgi:glycine C-acetyltransferase/8-amino-7-oxononanoate synthase
VLFGSGYLANLGVLGALAGPGDTIFSDELNHASIIDGCRASRAQVVVYRHLDSENLDWCLQRHRGQERRVIVTDSVFSMDGDIAPLGEIAELAHEHDARLVVDEAHATGVIGPEGRGVVAEAGLEDEVDVLVGTLGKALGAYGAYVCASETMVRYLINTARSLIYSTAPSPPAVAGALAALELLGERPHRIERLKSAARTMRQALAAEGFAVRDSDMHIIPLIVGDERDASRMCQDAIEHGVFAQAIRPPTVPAGTSRLRLTVMASHTERELLNAAGVLGRAARRAELDPSTIGQRRAQRAAPPDEEQTAVAGDRGPGVLFDVEREDVQRTGSVARAA